MEAGPEGTTLGGVLHTRPLGEPWRQEGMCTAGGDGEGRHDQRSGIAGCSCDVFSGQAIMGYVVPVAEPRLGVQGCVHSDAHPMSCQCLLHVSQQQGLPIVAVPTCTVYTTGSRSNLVLHILVIQPLMISCDPVSPCAAACLPQAKGACLGAVPQGTPEWERIAGAACQLAA